MHVMASSFVDEALRSLAEEARDFAISILDADGRVVKWDNISQDIKGFHAERITCEHFSRLYSEKDVGDDIPADALARAEAEGRSEVEGWRFRTDGSRFWANIAITPLRDKDGSLLGFAKVTRDRTRRMRADYESRRFASFPQLNPNLVMELGADGRVTYCNGPMKEVLKNAGCRDNVNPFMPHNLPEILLAFQQEKAHPSTQKIELNGSIYEEYICPVSQFGTIRIYATDITARTLAENELRKVNNELEKRVAARTAELGRINDQLTASETMKSLILDNMTDFVMYHDLSMKISWVNRRAAEFLDMPMEDIVERNCWELVHKRSEPCEDCPVMAARNTGTSKEVEIRTPAGAILLMRAYPVRNDQGLLTGIVEIVSDITGQKRAEEELRRSRDELEKRVAERTEQLEETVKALRASEERYALAVQGANDGIWDLDLATGKAYHSPRWKSILGYEDDEIAGNFREWQIRVHPDDYLRVMETGKAHEDGRIPVYEVEYRLRHKDGGYRWILGRGACLRDVQGKAYRMAGSITDVTERKKLEQQLLQAQKMESIGLLAGGVAHDFNNILTAITGYGETIRDSSASNDEVLRESIEQVLKGAERAAELTGSLLAFSRKQVMNQKPVKIDDIISGTGKLIRRIIGEDIEFNTCFCHKESTVMADAGQIEQVLMNLASNARDAMPHGGRLSISTKEALVKDGSEGVYDLPAAGRYVLVTVADTGAGIDKESMERIFEPFYTTKEIGKGTGLGLSIVYGIVKQHGGSVLVSSEPGEGTTFNLYLPIMDGAAVKEESKVSVPPAGGNETLLIVEDEEIVKVLLKKTLERAGYRVVAAGDGEEAVELFKEHDDISLVLSDVVMPGTNGREILEELKRIKPGMKVVFLSGYPADIVQGKGILGKDVDFISKPFLKADLLRKVRDMLDND